MNFLSRIFMFIDLSKKCLFTDFMGRNTTITLLLGIKFQKCVHVNRSTFSIVSLSPTLFLPRPFLHPSLLPTSTFCSIFPLSFFPRRLLHPFRPPLPHLLLSSIPHNFASYPFPPSPPFFHHVFFFSFI